MSMSNGKPARQTTKGSNPAIPVSADFMNDVWEVLGLNPKKDLSEKEVLSAVKKLVSDNKKAVEAGKKQPALVKEAGDKARQRQRAEDEKEIRDLKSAHAKEIEKLKAEHKQEVEKINKAHAQTVKELEDKLAKKTGQSPKINPTFMTDADKQRMQDAAKKAREAFNERDSIIEDQNFTDVFMTLEI